MCAACLTGINAARAQEAQTDSLTAAFFLLKYDYDVLRATTDADARLDSLIIAQTEQHWQARLDDEKAMRNRTFLMFGAAFILAGAALYAGSKLD